MYNPFYNRPDMKPYKAMVKPDPEEEERMHDVKMAHYADYRRKIQQENFWKSPFARYFMPLYADWEIR